MVQGNLTQIQAYIIGMPATWYTPSRHSINTVISSMIIIIGKGDGECITDTIGESIGKSASKQKPDTV